MKSGVREKGKREHVLADKLTWPIWGEIVAAEWRGEGWGEGWWYWGAQGVEEGYKQHLSPGPRQDQYPISTSPA